MYVLQIVVCSFVLFLLAIVLPVLLRFTDLLKTIASSEGWREHFWGISSYNNVAPVTTCVSAELQRGPIRHNGAKTKLQLKHKNSLFTLQTFHYNYTDDPSPC